MIISYGNDFTSGREYGLSFFRQNISVDMGSSTVLVSLEGKGIVLESPSLVAVKEGTTDIQAIGEDALYLMGRTPEEITTVRPVANGIISNYTMAAAMLRYFINKAVQNPLKKILKPDVIITIPCQTTNVEKRAVEQAALEAGARRVYLIYSPLAAAIGAGIDINKPYGNLVIDIGGGSTDIAVISYGGIVTSRSVKVGGNVFDETIKNYLKKNSALLIGDKSAELIKREVASLSHGVRNESMLVRGSDIITGLPNEKEIRTEEIVDSLIEAAMPILNGLYSVMGETPPELSADIYTQGVVLTGGGALISGIDELIKKSTGIDVTIAEDPVGCAVTGASVILEREKSK